MKSELGVISLGCVLAKRSIKSPKKKLSQNISNNSGSCVFAAVSALMAARIDFLRCLFEQRVFVQ